MTVLAVHHPVTLAAGRASALRCSVPSSSGWRLFSGAWGSHLAWSRALLCPRHPPIPGCRLPARASSCVRSLLLGPSRPLPFSLFAFVLSFPGQIILLNKPTVTKGHSIPGSGAPRWVGHTVRHLYGTHMWVLNGPTGHQHQQTTWFLAKSMYLPFK